MRHALPPNRLLFKGERQLRVVPPDERQHGGLDLQHIFAALHKMRLELLRKLRSPELDVGAGHTTEF